jgi:hypothetical protein
LRRPNRFLQLFGKAIEVHTIIMELEGRDPQKNGATIVNKQR